MPLRALLLAAAALLPAAALAAPPPRWVPDADQPRNHLLRIDPDGTARTGADDLLFLHAALGRLEDRILPTRVFEEEGFARRTVSFSYRFGKLVFVDLAPASWLPLVQHEVFGHGWRAREAGYEDIEYELAAPPPYGYGDGSTSWSFTSLPAPDNESSMALAGVEATDLLTQRLRGRWMTRGSMDYHEAWLYLNAAMGLGLYVSATDEEDPDAGNDMNAWLIAVNSRTGDSALGERWIRLRDLEDGSRLAFADPMFWFAAWTSLRYLWSGDARWRYPSLPLGKADWIPMLGYRLAPFGDQVVVENLFAREGRAAQVRVSWGDGEAGNSLGMDVEAHNLFAWNGFALDASLHSWRQPPLRLGGDRAPREDPETGFGVSCDVVSPALAGSWPLRAAAGFGIKERGYVPGEPLDGGLVLRAGVGIYR